MHACVEEGDFSWEQARVFDGDVPARRANVLPRILRLGLPPGFEVTVLRVTEASRRAISPLLPTVVLPGVASGQCHQRDKEPNTLRPADQPGSYAARAGSTAARRCNAGLTMRSKMARSLEFKAA